MNSVKCATRSACVCMRVTAGRQRGKGGLWPRGRHQHTSSHVHNIYYKCYQYYILYNCAHHNNNDNHCGGQYSPPPHSRANKANIIAAVVFVVVVVVVPVCFWHNALNISVILIALKFTHATYNTPAIRKKFYILYIRKEDFYRYTYIYLYYTLIHMRIEKKNIRNV